LPHHQGTSLLAAARTITEALGMAIAITEVAEADAATRAEPLTPGTDEPTGLGLASRGPYCRVAGLAVA
jgi:hypothetical protein